MFHKLYDLRNGTFTKGFRCTYLKEAGEIDTTRYGFIANGNVTGHALTCQGNGIQG